MGPMEPYIVVLFLLSELLLAASYFFLKSHFKIHTASMILIIVLSAWALTFTTDRSIRIMEKCRDRTFFAESGKLRAILKSKGPEALDKEIKGMLARFEKSRVLLDLESCE